MSCGVGCRGSSNLMLLWCRLAAVALTRPLAWKPPQSTGTALKRQKTKKKSEIHHSTKRRRKSSPQIDSFSGALRTLERPVKCQLRGQRDDSSYLHLLIYLSSPAKEQPPYLLSLNPELAREGPTGSALYFPVRNDHCSWSKNQLVH